MKNLLISTATAALLLGSAAADPSDQDNKPHDRGAPHEMQRGQVDRPANNQMPTNQTPTNSSPNYQGTNTRSDTARSVAVDRTSDANRNNIDVHRNVDVNRNVNVNKNVNIDRNVTVNRDVNVNRNITVNRTVNTRSRNMNFAQFRANITSPQRFHAPPYHRPSGFTYRRFVFGQRLPPVFFVRSYWLTDYVTFGLIAPPPGYVWVRYGNDALLVDEYTGEILQVRYDVFWS